jgi:hypothetical protein
LVAILDSLFCCDDWEIDLWKGGSDSPTIVFHRDDLMEQADIISAREFVNGKNTGNNAG